MVADTGGWPVSCTGDTRGHGPGGRTIPGASQCRHHTAHPAGGAATPASWRNRSIRARSFAVGAGITYVIIGVLGFIPGLAPLPADAPLLIVDAGYGYLFGFFPVNLLHNLVHLVLGAWGIIAARSSTPARLFARSLAVILGLLVIMGVIPGLRTAGDLMPLFGHDIWLHALTALAAAAIGFGVGEEAEHAAPGR